MPRVVSVSLGSPRGDFQHTLTLRGREIQIERVGTDGNVAAAVELLRKLDGKVDVLCLGGVNRFYYAGHKAFPMPMGQRLAAAVKHTPLMDGSWVKNYWEPQVIAELATAGEVQLKGKRVLLVSALDRPTMAKIFTQLGCPLVVGDAMFGLGLPVAFHSLALFNFMAKLTLPVLRLLPLAYLYPLGEKQNTIVPRFQKYYHWAQVIAGDFHFIYRHLPANLHDKIIITSTVRPEDVRLLKQRGVSLLITTAPMLAGRALAANVWEGVLRVIYGAASEQLELGQPLAQASGQTQDMFRELEFTPEILKLN
ncbi:MAG: hypothetical protein WA118_14385 [Carboxydocellales bacterium]